MSSASGGAPASGKKRSRPASAAAAPAAEDRRSSRLRGKARVRSVIDEETRRQVAQARLVQLEADNYEERPFERGESVDEAYGEEEEEVEVGGRSKGKKRKTRAGAGGMGGGKNVSDRSARGSARPIIRNLDQVIAEEDYDSDDVNYKTIAAPPSIYPPRHFCSVCGFFGSYTCPRCGLRFCSLRCQATHKETRCVKFAS